MTKIKICGLTRLADIEVANRFLPDYIGFVFAESRRRVTPDQAKILKAKLDPKIRAAGVFVNADPGVAAGLFRAGVIDVIQLHGQESEEDIINLKELTWGQAQIIKAVSVTGPHSLAPWLDTAADYLLLDHGKGGTGQSFDYHLIDWEQLSRPFFLAGGISPENAVRAIKMCRPFAVDVSSGVETKGLKDAEKIARLIRRVRNE